MSGRHGCSLGCNDVRMGDVTISICICMLYILWASLAGVNYDMVHLMVPIITRMPGLYHQWSSDEINCLGARHN